MQMDQAAKEDRNMQRKLKVPWHAEMTGHVARSSP